MEVLVAVVVTGTAVTALMGILRSQVGRPIAPIPSEARLILEEAANRFQYGDGQEEERLVAGKYGEYHLFFLSAGETGAGDAGTTAPIPSPSSVSGMDVAEVGVTRLIRRVATVAWTDKARSEELRLEVWRFEREVPANGG